MSYLDRFSLGWELLVYKWADYMSNLKESSDEYQIGLCHAYQEVLRNVDENAVFASIAELEIQTQELISKCDRQAVPAVTAYGKGFAEGMRACSHDLQELRKRTIG